MKRDDIYLRVLAVAAKFGPGNPQEFKLLSSQLSKCSPEEVHFGLLMVFERSEGDESNYSKQELAGRLLEKLTPNASSDLSAKLRAILPVYNPSIEQLPEFLAALHGRERVIDALKLMQTEFGESRAGSAAKTMRWWLKDASLKGENAA